MKKLLFFAISAMLVMASCGKSDTDDKPNKPDSENPDKPEDPDSDKLPELPDPTDICSGMDDIEFMKYCYEHFDVNKDGKISEPEYNAVKEINCDSLQISSFKGIEYFANLETFSCKENTKIKTVDLSHNKKITSIGEKAFYNCKSLTSIAIPDSVTEIGDSAFYGCTSLTGVYITDIAAWCSIEFSGDYSNPLYYAHNLYLNGKLVTDLVIPADVTEIGNRAFSGCTGLTSVTIPDSVTSIGDRAFSGCTGELYVNCNIPDVGFDYNHNYPYYPNYYNNPFWDSEFTKVIIGDNVKSIGVYAFYGCDSITNVTIGNSVTSIGGLAFLGCTSLKAFYGKFASADNRCLIDDGVLKSFAPAELTTYIIPDSVTSIGVGAFANCKSLTSIAIPDSVTSIGGSAFSGCTGLTSIAIPDSVTSIGGSAFSGCTGLTSVTIPDRVTEIGNYAFKDCTSLSKVNITDLAAWCSIEFSNYYSNPLYYAHNLYLNGNLVTDLVIPDSITKIGSYAFYGCESLTSVYITDLAAWCSIEFSNYYSNPLSYAHNLYLTGNLVTDLVIPDSVTKIGSYAFCDCTSLTSITIPDSVTSIGGVAFYGCTGLTSVTIGNSVTYIGVSAFYGCTGLTSVTIGEGVTEIGDYAFFDCTNLNVYCKPITPPDLGEYVFYKKGYHYANPEIYVPRASVDTYKSALHWKDYASRIYGYDFE